jgi:hypothetical protein
MNKTKRNCLSAISSKNINPPNNKKTRFSTTNTCTHKFNTSNNAPSLFCKLASVLVSSVYSFLLYSDHVQVMCVCHDLYHAGQLGLSSPKIIKIVNLKDKAANSFCGKTLNKMRPKEIQIKNFNSNGSQMLKTISCMNSLEKVSIYNLNLTHLKKQHLYHLLKLKKLKRLVLIGFQFPIDLSPFLNQLPALTTVTAENVNLTQLSLANATQLKKLNLRSTVLGSFSSLVFFSFTNLQYLNLGDNFQCFSMEALALIGTSLKKLKYLKCPTLAFTYHHNQYNQQKQLSTPFLPFDCLQTLEINTSSLNVLALPWPTNVTRLKINLIIGHPPPVQPQIWLTTGVKHVIFSSKNKLKTFESRMASLAYNLLRHIKASNIHILESLEMIGFREDNIINQVFSNVLNYPFPSILALKIRGYFSTIKNLLTRPQLSYTIDRYQLTTVTELNISNIYVHGNLHELFPNLVVFWQHKQPAKTVGTFSSESKWFNFQLGQLQKCKNLRIVYSIWPERHPYKIQWQKDLPNCKILSKN